MPLKRELRRKSDKTIFVATHDENSLLALHRKADGTEIPPESQTFRRLENGNKGDRFEPI